MQGLLRGRAFSSVHRNRWALQTRVPRTTLPRSLKYGLPHRYNSNSAVAPNTTPIEKLILDHVKAAGPISHATYMQFCLGHPEEGYYMSPKNPIFGPKGDFVTSPEISQLFGEMIAVWLFSQWLGAGSPESLRLVELGPGRGTLMADILHTFKQLFTSRKVNPNVEIHLVENSETLRGLQRQKLSDFGHELQWHDSINTISKSTTQYTMLVAHEFFDALPVHILMKSEQGWRELQVGSSEIVSEAYLESWYKLQVACKNERPHLLSFFHAEPTPVATVLGNSSPRFSTVSKGAHLEVSPAAFKIAYKVGELLSRKESEDDVQGLGGCGLIIDYGSSDPPLNTIRAFKDHKQVHPLHRPGECDLTGNVDFGYLKEAMQDLVPVYPPIEQGVFLQHMGLSSRLRSLAQNTAELSAEEAQERYNRLLQGATRLADPREMGSQYKFLGISSNSNTEDGAHVYPFGIGAEGTGDEVTSQPRARD